jgi:sulfur-carrier protein
MITFNVTGFLTDFTGGLSQIPLDDLPLTVSAGLNRLWELFPGLRDRVVNERGEVRPHVNIFVNNENIKDRQSLSTPLSAGEEITILPSVSGG